MIKNYFIDGIFVFWFDICVVQLYIISIWEFLIIEKSMNQRKCQERAQIKNGKKTENWNRIQLKSIIIRRIKINTNNNSKVGVYINIYADTVVMFLSRKSNNNLYLPNSSPKCFNAVPRVWAARMRTFATCVK